MDWTSFGIYAQYIRRLLIDGDLIQDGLVDDILRSPHNALPLLPNVEFLALIYPQNCDSLVEIAFARLFLNVAVKSITVYNIPSSSSHHQDGLYRLSDLIDDIIHCAPNVESLKMTSRDCPNEKDSVQLDSILQTLIQGLTSLTDIELSPCYVTSRVALAMSQSKHLVAIRPESTGPDSWGQFSEFTVCEDSGAYFRSLTPEGAWSRITTYTAVISPQQFVRTLQEAAFPSNQLTQLVLLSTSSFSHNKNNIQVDLEQLSGYDFDDDPEVVISNFTINTFFEVASRQCFALTSLYLDFCVPYIAEDRYYNFPSLHYHDLLPLKEMQSLTELTVLDKRVLSLTDSQLFDFLHSLRLLQKLVLCHLPYWVPMDGDIEQQTLAMRFEPPPTLSTMHSISTILHALPNIEHIGLYIDFRTSETIVVSDSDEICQSSALKILDLGYSAPPKHPVADSCLRQVMGAIGKVVWGNVGLYKWGQAPKEMQSYIKGEQRKWHS